VDEAVIRQIGALAKQLGTTKKAVIEQAVQALVEKVTAEQRLDWLAMTSGAWAREETVEETVERARAVFRDGVERHHR
jgi:predicted transcriptional regulator